MKGSVERGALGLASVGNVVRSCVSRGIDEQLTAVTLVKDAFVVWWSSSPALPLPTQARVSGSDGVVKKRAACRPG